jgi:Fe-S cluster assembly ATP-binding protein
MFKVKQLSVSVEDKQIIKGVSFAVQPGTFSVCMGPNGSGKSSLANALAGHPSYQITAGTITLNGQDLTELTPDKRAKAGLFLSVQHPLALSGVTVITFLKESFRALNKEAEMELFQTRLVTALKILELDESFLTRSVNVGFSGGQKKKCEMLQLLVLQPKVALLDEIDSGLDVDALKCVGKALNWFIKNNKESALFIITHYQNILEYIKPDHVLIMFNGQLVSTGNGDLVLEVTKGGYGQFSKT